MSFEDNTHRTRHTYFPLKVEIKTYNVIDGQNLFDQPVKNDPRTCKNIQKL